MMFSYLTLVNPPGQVRGLVPPPLVPATDEASRVAQRNGCAIMQARRLAIHSLGQGLDEKAGQLFRFADHIDCQEGAT